MKENIPVVNKTLGNISKEIYKKQPNGNFRSQKYSIRNSNVTGWT